MPWTATPAAQPQPTSEWIVASMVTAGLAVVSLALAVVSHLHQPPSYTVQAILAGSRQVPSFTDDDAGDADLAEDMETAGEVWARDHHPDRAEECPQTPLTFARGCMGRLDQPVPPHRGFRP